MNRVYEKADITILNKCKSFINQNQSNSSNYYIYREALYLYAELSRSLIDSHKELDVIIGKAADDILKSGSKFQGDGVIYDFNQSKISLILDEEAHEILGQLTEIINKNTVNNSGITVAINENNV